jgi:hypothetical protein
MTRPCRLCGGSGTEGQGGKFQTVKAEQTESGTTPAANLQNHWKPQSRLRLAIVRRWSSRVRLANGSTGKLEMANFVLDKRGSKLLGFSRGRGTREIHRQMQAIAFRMSGNARRIRASLYLVVDFSFIGALTAFSWSINRCG